MSNPKLNRCLHCGSSDSMCIGQRDTCECNECGASWDGKPYVAKALETLGEHLRNGHRIVEVEIGDRMEWVASDFCGKVIASGETFQDMVMDLQDRVGT